MSRHVQNTDTAVLERRLRPIYDWLDSGSNKKALQECDKVLKKTPNFHCAKALKALTLLRLGREKDAIVILDNLTSEQPTEEATLQAMALCYRDMHELHKICNLYDTAVKLNPTNEELHTHLFMSYVRLNDFKAQQKSAMALYKQKPKNPYYCWNVMSIVLQATRGEGAEDEAKKNLLLNLAERMMQKLVDDNKMDAEQEIQLYIMILELQQKYENILDILDGPLRDKMQCSNISQLKLKYLKKINKWQQVNTLCTSLLLESFDKWDIWIDYVQSVFELPEVSINGDALGESENNVDTVDNTAEKCHEFICGIIEGGAENSYLLRGPFLSRFEFCLKLHERNIKTEDILGDRIELFIEYFRKFGHKPSCVSDLRIYLKLLDVDQKAELATKLVREVGIGSTSVPQSVEQMQRHIGALQLARLCGNHRNLSIEHLKALVTALTLHYQHGYQSYGKTLPPTDIGPSDNYALLAAHILYDISRKEDGSDSLISAAALLENLLRNSPSNFHAKLLLLKLYHILGAGLEANNVYYILDIKHLQLDSLGYIHCGRLATIGQYSLCEIHYSTTLKFFSSNYKDSSDHLTFSYKFGSFMKLDEFMDFREKLNNSLHYITVFVDRILLSLKDCSSLECLFNTDLMVSNNIDWDKLRDNRDLRVFINWEPEFADNMIEKSGEIQKLFVQDLHFLKLKTHLLWSITAVLQVLKSVDGTRQKNIEHMRSVLTAWKSLENDVKKCDISPISEELVTYPLPSRLHGYLDIPYRSTVTSLLEFLESLVTENPIEIEKKCAEARSDISTLGPNLEQKYSGGSSDFREKRKGVELAVNTVEVICIAYVICILCRELIKPPTQTKKSKKKQPVESVLRNYLDRIVEELKTQINKTSDLVQQWCLKISEGDLINAIDSLNLSSDISSLYEIIKRSYATSNKEMQEVLRNKLKLLNHF